VGRDAGGVVRNHTNKKILPSSGERLIRRAKRRIVLDVFLARGPTWKHIREMRERWGIEAQTQVPPPYQGAEYTPQALQSRPEEEFGEEAERWHATFDEWRNDLAALYEAVIPDEARGSGYMTFGWSVFLSMCVLFDPPETQLVEFAETLLESMAEMVPKALDDLTGEEKNRVYRMLRLEVAPRPEGYDVSGALCAGATPSG
jgi:hypothetical protein